MNRGTHNTKMNGGFNADRFNNALRAVAPAIENIEQVIDKIDKINQKIIIPAIPIIKAGLRFARGGNADPAHRLRKLALKSKKVVVIGKGRKEIKILIKKPAKK